MQELGSVPIRHLCHRPRLLLSESIDFVFDTLNEPNVIVHDERLVLDLELIRSRIEVAFELASTAWG